MKKRKRSQVGMFRCGWCGKKVREEDEVFTVPGKAWPEVDLSGVAGTILPIPITGRSRPAYALVSAEDSEAKKAGQDLLFTACSEQCAELLRDALRDEIRQGPP